MTHTDDMEKRAGENGLDRQLPPDATIGLSEAQSAQLLYATTSAISDAPYCEAEDSFELRTLRSLVRRGYLHAPGSDFDRFWLTAKGKRARRILEKRRAQQEPQQ